MPKLSATVLKKFDSLSPNGPLTMPTSTVTHAIAPAARSAPASATRCNVENKTMMATYDRGAGILRGPLPGMSTDPIDCSATMTQKAADTEPESTRRPPEPSYYRPL